MTKRAPLIYRSGVSFDFGESDVRRKLQSVLDYVRIRPQLTQLQCMTKPCRQIKKVEINFCVFYLLIGQSIKNELQVALFIFYKNHFEASYKRRKNRAFRVWATVARNPDVIWPLLKAYPTPNFMLYPNPTSKIYQKGSGFENGAKNRLFCRPDHLPADLGYGSRHRTPLVQRAFLQPASVCTWYLYIIFQFPCQFCSYGARKKKFHFFCHFGTARGNFCVQLP